MFSGVIATRVETKQSSAANKRGQRNGCVQAIYDYVPQYEAELALHLGDIIEVFLLSPRRRFSDASYDFELLSYLTVISAIRTLLKTRTDGGREI